MIDFRDLARNKIDRPNYGTCRRAKIMNKTFACNSRSGVYNIYQAEDENGRRSDNNGFNLDFVSTGAILAWLKIPNVDIRDRVFKRCKGVITENLKDDKCKHILPERTVIAIYKDELAKLENKSTQKSLPTNFSDINKKIIEYQTKRGMKPLFDPTKVDWVPKDQVV